MSAHPMTPKPILRFALTVSAIWGRGYVPASMTLSSIRTAMWVTSRRRDQSILGYRVEGLGFRLLLTNLARLIEPRLHASKG